MTFFSTKEKGKADVSLKKYLFIEHRECDLLVIFFLETEYPYSKGKLPGELNQKSSPQTQAPLPKLSHDT